MADVNSYSSTYCYLTGFIWKVLREKIEKKIGRELEGWDGPEITLETKEYKLDYYPPDDSLSEEYLTLYSDGVWQFYGKDGDIEGRIDAPHSRRWISRMTKQGTLGIVAHGAVMFFKDLKDGRKLL